MKDILKSALVLMLCVLASCEKPAGTADEYLDVTAGNLAGDWELESWNDGTVPDGGFAVYLRFVRKDARYEMYSNVGSMQFVRKTGNFVIIEDEDLGYVISGSYDYTLGQEWNHRYMVALTAGRMTWTSCDDPSDVCVYVRTQIPEEIISAFPPVEE